MMGGTVCIPSEHERLNDIAGFINLMRINHAVLTPSFVSFLEPGSVPGLRRLVLAGEAMSPSHVATWSHIELVNGYGPAESSVAAVVNSSVGSETEPNDIGVPCGVRVWLVDPDEHNRLVPIGCIGEMLLEGPSLARGYLNDSAKTEESFIADPTWAQHTVDEGRKRRFYKTGDLGRYNSASGSLSYLGRKDTQVKLHGQRIELGEIEHQLLVDESVHHAMILLPQRGPVAGRLIAVLSLPGTSITTLDEPSGLRLLENPSVTDSTLQEVRERLSMRLPAYMVPVVWFCVNTIPMLPSRKMDRRSVTTWVETVVTAEQCQRSIMASHPSETVPSCKEQDEKPLQTEIEAKLRHIWSLVLNLPADQISLDNRSFLSLGGDSISAMACASHAKRAQLDVGVQSVLRAKSLRELARVTKPTSQLDVGEQEEGELLDSASELSPIQQLHFQVRGLGQGKEHFNQSFCLRLSRHVEAPSVHEALRVVVRRHGMLRARFHTCENGKWQQLITSDVDSSYRFRSHNIPSCHDISGGIASAQGCLDVRHGPLLAAEMFSVEEENRQILFLTAHHLIVDLVSWRIILEEMEEILETHSAATMPVHRSLAFTTWATLQRDDCFDGQLAHIVRVAGNVPTAQLAYWGMNNQPNLYGDVVCSSFELDVLTSSTISAECHTAFHTETVDVLLAALIWSFHNIFHDRNIPPIFNEGHGREALSSRSTDISRTVGWFTTLFPVAINSLQSFEETLVKTKDLRRSVQGNGRAHFAMQFHAPEGQALQHKDMEITFNYLGRYQQFERPGALFIPAEGSLLAGEAHQGSPTADFGPAAQRFALFEISAVVINGALRLGFAWNARMHHQERISEWISNCRQVLIEAAATLPCLERRMTVSDFSLIKGITPQDLEAFEKTTLPIVTAGRGWDAIQDIYPASPLQQGVLLSQTKDDNAYAVRRSFKVSLSNADSFLSADRIITAWRGVVQHHAILRTIFVNAISRSGAASYDQVVFRDIEPVVVVRECSGDENEMRRMIKDLNPARYANDGLQHRLSVFHDSKATNVVFCVLELSHAVIDGASMDILLRDLANGYEGRLDQTTRPLFSPFVASLQERNAQADLTFWTTYLEGLGPCHFPVLSDRVGGIKIGRELRTFQVVLPSLSALRAFCDKTGVTIPTAIHAAWGLTLACYTGTDDICFGYLVSGRDAAIEGSEVAVGPFINMATQRVRLGGKDEQFSLLHILEAVQKDQLDAMAFAQASLAEVQHALSIPGGLALFNTCVSYRRVIPSKLAQGSLIWKDVEPVRDPTEYPISLNVEMNDKDEASIDMDYWTDMVSSEQAENVAMTFMQAISNIVQHADMPISQLDLVHPAAKERIFRWNADMPSTAFDCLHRMVEKQVAIRPSQQAIRGWDGNFSYAEMNVIADRLANHLFDLGVGPEILVPVCFDKSAYTTIAMLAILKAGGCVVPLNANDPINALEGKITDTGTHVVVSSETHAFMFETMVPYVVAVGVEFLSQLCEPEKGFNPAVSPSDPAFVMFTSGSTGKPKGVSLPHSALVSSTLAHGTALGLNPSTRFLQFAAHTFDNSIEEMFTTLIHGGCVCVPSEGDRLSNLPGAIDVLDANFMDLTPTVAALIRPEQVPKIRGLAVGGEALTQEVLDAWAGTVPVHNQYGPSECSINATHRLHANAGGDVANIGTSVGSVSWIADPMDHDRLVPIGCVGELLIEGPILARGYLNRPLETAKAFIEMPKWATLDPHHTERGTRRMYKTGDLVRYHSDGSLIYLGRKDSQVKLHGQRLEPGEIDHHIKTCLPTGAQSSVELLTLDKSKALAVFICCPSSSKDKDIRTLPVDADFVSLTQAIVVALAAILAPYMIPSLFIPVSSMPLTTSGKLDRRRLHALVHSPSEVESYRLGTMVRNGRAPETRMERSIQDLWVSVLNVSAESIGAEDSFFRHGGDSVGAMRFVAAARERGILLTVASIFQTPRLSDMANAAIDTSDSDGDATVEATPVLTPVEPFSLLKENPFTTMTALQSHVASICRVDVDDVQDIYPCPPLQAGLVAASQRQSGAYVAVNSYELPAGTDIPRFKKAWQDVVDSEAILRTRVVLVEGIGFLQVVVRSEITWATAASVDDLGPTHRQLPTHDGGILTRYTIIGENGNSPQFVWTAHHALYDGWSLPILLGRIETRYRQPGAPAVPVPHYSRFVEYLSTVDSMASDAFWTAKLYGSAPQRFPQLPYPGYRVQAASRASRTVKFTRPRAADLTTATFVRVAWALILSIYSASDDVVFGEVLNGRDVPVSGIENLVGPTLASVPRRIRVDRALTVAQFLADVQAQLIDILPHQFAGLQRIKTLGSTTAAACEFQTLLVVDTVDEVVADDSLWRNIVSTTQGADFFSYPLNFTCTVGSGGSSNKVELHATFDDMVVPKWQVARMLCQFETVLSRLTADENQRDRIGDVDFLNAEDKAVVRKWNEVPGPVVEQRVHDVICEQMARHSQDTAVVGWDATLSNGELDALSTALARELRTRGVGSSDHGSGSVFVPLCFEKSSFAVVAMLGVLKAGAAFVPLDPVHPVARLSEIVQDCSAEVILCSPKYERLCSEVARTIIPVDMAMLDKLKFGLPATIWRAEGA